jgi:hypothetical protein
VNAKKSIVSHLQWCSAEDYYFWIIQIDKFICIYIMSMCMYTLYVALMHHLWCNHQRTIIKLLLASTSCKHITNLLLSSSIYYHHPSIIIPLLTSTYICIDD